jgi:helicase
MKNTLPRDHGLQAQVEAALMYRDGGAPSLTDAQYAALEAGIGRGESGLVVSPTSTGKTQIALWALAQGLLAGCHTVYLVTHRALARQKFEDFRQQILTPFLGDDRRSLVVATGDVVADADGEIPTDPLRAPLLVATYEKYLALLSASGVPQDMSRTVIVCDEIQLIGDKSRGQHVEILLTLLKKAGWRQFVGLSAVLKPKDAGDLADWLSVHLVQSTSREKHLRYQCRAESLQYSVSTASPDTIRETQRQTGASQDPIDVAIELAHVSQGHKPVIVFCMTKAQPLKFAREYIAKAFPAKKGQMSLAFDGLPPTTANAALAELLPHRVGIHTADLTDDERAIVERELLENRLDVVFATTTLAAGVNFPLGAAVFGAWARWDFESRQEIPIDAADFHNMCGRVGRMGFDHDEGQIVYMATKRQLQAAQAYLQLGELPPIEPRIAPDGFTQLALQLTASRLCSTAEQVADLICNTFSALRERDRNAQSFGIWPNLVRASVARLVEMGFVIAAASGKLTATPVGRAVGYSGLLPETGGFIVDYMARQCGYMASLLPSKGYDGDVDQLAFLLFSACFGSPEFRGAAKVANTRYLPYQLEVPALFKPEGFREHLYEPTWQADELPINCAFVARKWIDGVQLTDLERMGKGPSAGVLSELFRSLAWLLQGMAAITQAGSDTSVDPECRPRSLRASDATLGALASLTRVIRRLAYRVQEGLPDDALWMTTVREPGAPFALRRHEILALRANGLGSPESLMLGTSDADTRRQAAFAGAKPTPQAKANWMRDACREWKKSQRRRAGERQERRAKRCANVELVRRFYSATGDDFEKAFEEVLTTLKVAFERLDDKTKTGAPDYLVRLAGVPSIVMELKTKQGEKLVDYNKAVEVLAASEIHGLREHFCVTLCHPGVDPSVPLVIASCGRLSVVESVDLGEALLRRCEGGLSDAQLFQWLASPGQALASDLPYRDLV